MGRITKTFEFTMRVSVEMNEGEQLNEKERAELLRMARYLEGHSALPVQSVLDFKRQIAEMSRHLPDDVLAKALGVHRATLSDWRRRFGVIPKQARQAPSLEASSESSDRVACPSSGPGPTPVQGP